MRCPFCQVDNDKVIDSRSGEDGYVIRRRRHCLDCNKRFTTFERVAELDLRVVKKDGSRESFQPEKIRKGIERACWKRPIPTEKVEQILMEIVQSIYLHEEAEIPSNSSGEMVQVIHNNHHQQQQTTPNMFLARRVFKRCRGGEENIRSRLL